MISPLSDLIISASLFALPSADGARRLEVALARTRDGLSPRIDDARGLARAALSAPDDADLRARLLAAVKALGGVRCQATDAWWRQ